MPGHVRSTLPFSAHLRARIRRTVERPGGVRRPSARAVYETPEVQVYERAKNRRVRDVIACLRATGKARKVDVRANDGMGTDEFSTVNEVLGGRWIWTSLLGSRRVRRHARGAAHRPAHRRDVLDRDRGRVQLAHRAGRPRRARRRRRGRCDRALHRRRQGDARDGAEHRPGRQRRARVLARAGRRAHGHVTLPAADPARARPLARTISRCKPRRGARLALRTESLVLSRSGGAVWACRTTRGRNYRLGAVDNLRPLSDRHVAYGSGLIAVFDAVRGNYRELEGTSAAATASALLASGPGGLRAWTAERPAATVLTADPASDVALGDGVAYWLDGAGTPRPLTSNPRAARRGRQPARAGPAPEPALAVEHLPGHPAAIVGGQPRDQARGVVGLAPATGGEPVGDGGEQLGRRPAVSTGPGLTQLTVMPRSASSSASVSVIAASAPLDAA